MNAPKSMSAGPLPIDAVLGQLRAALDQCPRVVLSAPPGAGKTTRVPLALLEAPWLAGKRIVLLEPRRLAARAAAERMAELMGDSLGGTIGLRMRLATHVSARTRIEVVTEGVFTRMILDDPELAGVGAVVLDEFHERSLEADLALAFALDAQAALRPDLRLLVMSATLDTGRIAATLKGAPDIQAEGRMFPVDMHYVGRNPRLRLEDQVTDAILLALRQEQGSILVFLPGQSEIRRTAERLAARLKAGEADVVPLHGGLDIAEQRRATRPIAPGERRVILATSIAETSITIDGVRVVVDCGLARVPRYEVGAGVTRLETVRLSRASAEQRRGRAGRTEPGACYRLWDEPETKALPPFAEPEIRAAGLSGLLLDCAAWGTPDPASLIWIDPPPAAALEVARAELLALGALDSTGFLTPGGKRLRRLPLAPRLAHMVQVAADRGAASLGAELAAVLSERGIGGADCDLATRLAAFRRDKSDRARRLRQLAEQWARSAKEGAAPSKEALPASPGALLAAAFPERIAKSRGAAGQFLLANGRAAAVDAADPLAGADFIVVADLTGAGAVMRIQGAAEIGVSELDAIAADRIVTDVVTTFDRAALALRARRRRRLDAIELEGTPEPVAATLENARVLADGAASVGIERLTWSKAQRQLLDRVAFARAAPGSNLPDLSAEALSHSVADWLAPSLVGLTRLAEITPEVLGTALDQLLPYAFRRRLDADAPTHFEAPTGNRHVIIYEGAGAPILAIRVQELFGLASHPAIANGRLPLTLQLLSPAGRPIQITRDLPGFWKGSWSEVKAEMKGRYPRHPWPDDPLAAAPTTRAKPRPDRK